MNQIDLKKLNYTFSTPPLLIGGMAMEFYGLRPAGRDIDFVVTEADYLGLRAQYLGLHEQHPNCLRELWGDLGVCPFEFEIWRSICLFGYDDLAQGALDQGDYRVISLEKLLFLKALGYKVEKYRHDLELIVDRITRDRYAEQYEPTMQWVRGLAPEI